MCVGSTKAPAYSSQERPAVSVVLISDYASGQETGWNDLRRTLTGLAKQDFTEATEFLLIESEQLAPSIPADIRNILPTLRVIAVPAWASYELKNAAVRAASAELVAMLDGDCAPDRDWLRQLVSTMRAHPEAAAVSGKTTHDGDRLLNRTMAATNRSYLDVGGTGPTLHISNNNALFRRSIYLKHPLRTDVGPFGSRIQSEAIMRAGAALLFEPRARVLHAYEGWETESNFRRAFGYGIVRTRRADPRLPYAWALRLGYLSIPFFVLSHILTGWWRCMRYGHGHRVAWHELPFAFALVAIASTMEVGGMVSAFRNQEGVNTLFR